MHKYRKAWYFTFDAILFAIIIFTALYFASQPAAQLPQTFQTQIISEDLLGVMDAQYVSELDPVLYADFAGNYSEGELTVLEQVGQWWADDNNALVDAFVANYTASLVRDELGISLHIDNDAIFQDTSPTPRQLAAGLRVVSGVEKSKPVKGAVASARALRVILNKTHVETMSPQGAGWGSGRVDMTKTFDLPTNISIVEGLLVASVHADTSASDRTFYVNNCTVQLSSSEWLYGAEGDVGETDITSCLRAGSNTWTASMNNNGYNAHTHPGMYLYVFYTENTIVQDLIVENVSKKLHFDQIESMRVSGSSTGAWMGKTFEIPRDAANLSVSIKVDAEGIRDYTGSAWFYNYDTWDRRRNYDYQIFLNSPYSFDSDANPSSSESYFYDMTELQNRLVNGTNLVSVFFNNYMDYVWGNQDLTILNSSYIELNYTVPADALSYGLIELTDSFLVGGSDTYDKTMSFSFPAQAVETGDARVYIVQQYSNRVTVWADAFNPPTTEIFESPAPRGVPSEVFIPKEQLESSSTVSNFVRVRDVGSGNRVLNISRIQYEFSVPSSVGFGEVFATQAEAEADAVARLSAAMGGFVAAQDIETQSSVITDVPTLWGPAEIEVRSWQ